VVPFHSVRRLGERDESLALPLILSAPAPKGRLIGNCALSYNLKLRLEFTL